MVLNAIWGRDTDGNVIALFGSQYGKSIQDMHTLYLNMVVDMFLLGKWIATEEVEQEIIRELSTRDLNGFIAEN